MAKKRLHAYFSGTVQGVGFRFSSQRIAASLKINGWVRNLYDGRVEVVAEGPKQSIESFLEELKRSFEDYIRDIDLDWQEPEGLRNFEIKF